MTKSIVMLVGNDREQSLYRVAGRGIRISKVIASRAQTERLGTWRTACEQLGVPYQECTRNELANAVAEARPSVLVSVGFPLIVSAEVLGSASLALNVHPALLPKYRGALSGYFILAHNEPQSGVTIHEMTELLDAGDILSQKSFPLTAFDTPLSMMQKSRRLEADMLADVLDDVVHERPLHWTKQNEADATEFLAKRTPNDSVIDPSKSLLELFPHIRACDPDKYPAFFMLHDQKVCVRLWRPDKSPDEADAI